MAKKQHIFHPNGTKFDKKMVEIKKKRVLRLQYFQWLL